MLDRYLSNGNYIIQDRENYIKKTDIKKAIKNLLDLNILSTDKNISVYLDSENYRSMEKIRIMDSKIEIENIDKWELLKEKYIKCIEIKLFN